MESRDPTGTPCCRGAVFDLDGVVTRTARVHFRAWKRMFDDFLAARGLDPFTEEDYRRFVDGRPRYQGVKELLESRDIELPFGKPEDAPELETICGLGNRKNEEFRRIVAEDGVEIYDSTVAFIHELKARGYQIGLASSSMNCEYILEKTGLDRLFDTVIGGQASRELGLQGKPQPDIFVVAADNLGLRPGECMLFEDAISGVEAGRNGNFALVVGITRDGNREALQEHGADIVVSDLAELTFEQIDWWFRTGIIEDGWNLTYHGLEPAREMLRETLTTVGNGYFGTRGAFAACRADESVHYPGTYIAGVYNRLTSDVNGRTIVNNDLVNCPNWLLIELSLGDGDFLQPLEQEVLRYRHTLNMKAGITSHSLTFRDAQGRVTAMETSRFASMADPHLAAIRCRVTALNWSGRLSFRSTLDGTVINFGVPRYRKLSSRHLEPIGVQDENGCICLEVRTSSSEIHIFQKARHRVFRGGEPAAAERRVSRQPALIAETLTLDIGEGQTCGLDKIVALYTSRDRDVENPERAWRDSLAGEVDLESLLEAHRSAWADLWVKADFRIEGDRFAQQAVRLHAYHLLCTASPHNLHLDAGLPARGLHGEAYRGHIFWDELFIYPFYNLHFPEITRALLLYRYRRLDAARRNARESGCAGAMYPWQSADTGEEETQVVHFNPVSGTWGPDLSRLQRHVSLAIAYNVWEYFYVTGDRDFIHEYGAEMMLEIARFWADLASFDERDGRYHIRGVMGPDEFHEKYPGAEEGGLNDNAYTNIMASWLMHKTIQTLERLPGEVLRRLESKTGFRVEEMERWRDIVRRMYVEISADGILAQFSGYLQLPDLDWDLYRRKYGDIHRLDRILKAEGDSPDRYQVSKQADVLMIFYLLSPGQVKNILSLMGYPIGDELEFLQRNYEYYFHRTSHGSTLSFVVHAAILRYLEARRGEMWRGYLTCLRSDIQDIQGGTTPEGIHTGVMGGTLDMLVRTFAGINLFKDAVWLDPVLPSHWSRLSLEILHRDNLLEIDVEPERVRLEPRDRPQKVRVAGRELQARPGRPLEVPLPRDRPKASP